MKLGVLLVLLLFLSVPVLALDKLTGFVNDEADVISPEYEQALNQVLYDLKLNTSAEMAVATVKTTGDVPIEEYSINLAHNVLGEKEKDNGILVLLAVDDRAYRIEVGYGLEPIINDALAGRIGREVMAPRFREGNYEQGLLDGVLAISSVLRKSKSFETQGSGVRLKSRSTSSGVIVELVFWLFLLAIITLSSFPRAYKYAKKKSDEKRRKGERPDAGDFIAAMVVASMFGRGGRGRGGLGGISGFGGFGGGGFGGGGFSGRF